MKSKYFFIGFLFLNVLSLSTIAYGHENWILVKVDDEMNYKIISFNKELADEYLGDESVEEVFGHNAQVGAYRYYEILKIDYYDDLYPDDENKTLRGWIIDVEMRGWMNNKMWRYYNYKPRYKIYDSLIILDDAKFLGLSFTNIELLLPPYFIPDPVEDYLDDIDWNDDFKINEKQITHKYEEIKGKDLTMIYEIASNGFLLNQKLLTDTNQIIYEYGLEGEPIILINIFFILIAVFTFSILFIEFIYIILKKRNLQKINKREVLCIKKI